MKRASSEQSEITSKKQKEQVVVKIPGSNGAIENLSKEEILRTYRMFRRDALKCAPHDEFNVVRPEHETQARAAAAVHLYRSFNELSQIIPKAEFVSLSSFKRARFIRDHIPNPTLTYSVYFRYNGRPRKYDSVVDDGLIKWLRDVSTTSVEKLMSGLISKYRYFHQLAVGEDEARKLKREGIRRHLNDLLRANGFRMRAPKVIEAKRCVRYETIYNWQTNRDVVVSLTSVDPDFLFNCDETNVNHKGGIPGEVACLKGTQPCIVVEDREGNHVTLFLTVSATGEVVNPIIIHGKPHEYIKPECKELVPQLRFYETENGYMDKACFKRIMIESFIPYVKEKRDKIIKEIRTLEEKLNTFSELQSDPKKKREKKEMESLLSRLVAKNTHAVLVADGHKSRYDPETLQVLRDADIDLLIIPAHSSHILQPLDLRLNGLIKDEFRTAWIEDIPTVLLATVTLKPKKGSPTELEFVKAEYDRVHMISAIRNAISKALTPSNILSAWKTAHLYPFLRDPAYTKEKELENLRELRSSSIQAKVSDIQETDGTRTGVINLPATGVINSESNLPIMREMLTREFVSVESNDSADVVVSAGPLTLFLLPSEFDAVHVGDYFRIIPGVDGNPDRLLPVSDAPLFFNYDAKDID